MATLGFHIQYIHLFYFKEIDNRVWIWKFLCILHMKIISSVPLARWKNEVLEDPRERLIIRPRQRHVWPFRLPNLSKENLIKNSRSKQMDCNQVMIGRPAYFCSEELVFKKSLRRLYWGCFSHYKAFSYYLYHSISLLWLLMCYMLGDPSHSMCKKTMW